MSIVKLLIICASLAIASAASIPSADNSLAFETEDAYYVPISDAEAAQLGLPDLQAGAGNRQKREVLLQPFETDDAYYVPISDAEAAQLGLPDLQAGTGNRQKREVLVEPFETEDAYYIPISDEEAEALRLPRSNNLFAEPEEVEVESPARSKRQINIQGGGSRGQGFDIYAQGRAKLWESDNKRNTIHGTAQYGQHLGGPYGNSRPSYGGGLTFTHRF